MKIHDASYVKSAPDLKTAPDLNNLPEIVLVGRSNVGKSSFINALLLRKNLAQTSNTPGKTRLMNFYHVIMSESDIAPRRELAFVDLPGYGYAKVSKTEQERWRRNFERYLVSRPQIRLVFQLIDGRHGAQDSDISMFEWLQYHGLPVQLVLTKADKAKRADLDRHVRETAKGLDVTAENILTFSAETRAGRAEAWKRLLVAIDTPRA